MLSHLFCGFLSPACNSNNFISINDLSLSQKYYNMEKDSYNSSYPVNNGNQDMQPNQIQSPNQLQNQYPSPNPIPPTNQFYSTPQQHNQFENQYPSAPNFQQHQQLPNQFQQPNQFQPPYQYENQFLQQNQSEVPYQQNQYAQQPQLQQENQFENQIPPVNQFQQPNLPQPQKLLPPQPPAYEGHQFPPQDQLLNPTQLESLSTKTVKNLYIFRYVKKMLVVLTCKNSF